MAEEKTRDLAAELAEGDPELLEGILEAFRDSYAAGFWQLPFAVDDGSIVLDGATWTIEGRRDGRCHVVTRQSPEPRDELRAFAETLIDLSGKRFYYDEVY